MDYWSQVLHRAVEASRNGILITDPNQSNNPIVYVNPAFERITGYTAAETLGCNPRFLQGSDRDQPVLEKVRTAIREQRSCRVVVRNYRKDGTLFFQEMSISPVHDEQGHLTHFIGIQDDITARKLLEDRLARQALLDPLTDLPNRSLFTHRLQQALSRVARLQQALAVLFLDLDDFKAINDEFGHEVGDRLLVLVAKRLKASLRAPDTAARLGGDEFMILLEGTDRAEGANQVAARILEELRKPFVMKEGELRVTASIGIALITNGLGKHPHDVLRLADLAMYQTKRAGKDDYSKCEV